MMKVTLTKTTFLLLATGFGILSVNAEDPSDSIPTVDLKEVVVEGDMQRVNATSVIYTPDKQQKQAATSAIDLLQKMGIPQLQVDILGESAKTLSGQPLSYFINYIPASSEQLKGMRTKDVKRIEYLEYPSDPRFRGAEHVINYIMVEYEYGGYTKFSDSAWIWKESTNNNFSIYSKFAYKLMSYDLYIGENYINSHHFGSKNDQTFRLGNAGTGLYDVKRTVDIDKSFTLDNNLPVNFRATYAKADIQIDNRVWFNFDEAPYNHKLGSFTVSPSNGTDYKFRQSNPGIYRNAGWSGSYFFLLPQDWSISIGTDFNYSSTNRTSEYSSTLLDSPIDNSATDRSFYGKLSMYLTKTFAGKHQTWVEAREIYGQNNVVYLDTDTRNKFQQNYGGFGLGYSSTFSNKLRLRVDAGVAYDRNKINDVTNLIWQPYSHLNINYAPNQYNGLGFYFQYATNSPQMTEKSPNVIRLDEILYAKGNPDLKPSDHITLNLNWSWTPRSFLAGSVNASYFQLFNNYTLDYSPYDNGNAIIRSYNNDGSFKTIFLSANFTFYLLKRSLQLTAGPSFRHDAITGQNPISKNIFRGTVQATYMLKGFYAMLGYYSPYRALNSEGSYTNIKTSEYMLSLGWSNSDWNIRVNFKNMFDSTWIEASYYYNSPYYDSAVHQYGINRHRQVSIQAFYTFGYGKKIRRSGELGAGQGAFNAIMQ